MMLKNILFTVAILSGHFLLADKLPSQFTFSNVWSEINLNSAAQAASKMQLAAVNESKYRSARHWLPRVYLGAQTYQTNDPGSSFFGLLSQRSVLNTDFNPDLMNHPETTTYTKGALGVDLPIYEGGMKSSQVDLYKSLAQAQENTVSQIQIEQFGQASLSYGSIAVLIEQQNKISELNQQIEKILKNYQLGNRSNPVGYSGLLGMKSLINRLSGLKKQYQAQINSNFAILKEMGLKNENWTPESIPAAQFVEKYLSVPNTNSASFKVQAIKNNVIASEESAAMEKAKFLPRIGAFAESQIFKGDRDTANSYVAGLYLQWNLFDSSAFGILKESHLKTDAYRKSAEALEQQERAEKFAINESLSALKENISLLNDSYKMLIEQSKITETLFKNGSISALQFTEVLSRRADLISLQVDAEIGIIKAASQSITKQKFEIKL